MTLVLVSGEHDAPQVIQRVPQGAARREDVLRDMLYAHPAMLPVSEINPGVGPLVAIARELNVPDVGRIDAFFADARGNLIIVECKLWRNPQARREVVGQILDYARALARFSYEDLQREVSRATGRKGNALYELVCGQGEEVDEARFVDQVSRNLAAGRFLLLVVGDGIAEGTQRIGEYLVAQPGLAFDFGLVEMAQYAWRDAAGAEQIAVQPRLLARTVVIERAVIRNEASVVISDLRDEPQLPAADDSGSGGSGGGRKFNPALQQAWRSFAERFLGAMSFDDPSQPPLRIGGLGWMKAPLPRGHWLTLYRSSSSGKVGAWITLAGSEGLELYQRLLADRTMIDEEFSEAGLPSPRWNATAKEATIALSWPSPLPWDEREEDRQAGLLRQAANQMVNSIRPRLEQIGAPA